MAPKLIEFNIYSEEIIFEDLHRLEKRHFRERRQPLRVLLESCALFWEKDEEVLEALGFSCSEEHNTESGKKTSFSCASLSYPKD